MLLKLQDVVSGWIAGAIVGLIVIVFAFFGLDYYFRGGSSTQAVAKVGDRTITIPEYQRAYQNYRQQVQQALGQSFDPSSDELIRQEALNQLIETQVLTQLAIDAGLRISDADVVTAIGAIKAFQDDSGKFSQSRYEQALARIGMSSAGFEQQIRLDMLLQQLQTSILATAFVTDADVSRLARIEAQTRDIRYVTLAAQPLYDAIEVSDADIQSYYEDNIDHYQAPAKVRIAYIDLTIDSLLDEVDVSEQDLHAYYDSHSTAYTVEPARKVTQMYIKLGADAKQEQIDAAQEAMQFIQGKLDAGMSMEEVADQHEERLGPDFEQITLGFTPRGVLPPALDEVVFSMEPDEVSDIIRSDAGLHIVRVDAVKGGETGAFADVRDQVEADYRRQKAEQIYFEQADRLATLAYENPRTLEPAAEALGVEIQTTDWFTQDDGSGIAAEPEVKTASFSDEVLGRGLNSQLLELGDSRLVVLRVAEHQPTRPQPLAEVREEIVDAIKRQRAREQTTEKGRAILQALESGQSAEAVAAEYSIDWQQTEAVTRNDPQISRAILRTAFSIARPEGKPANYDGSSLGSGDYIVVGVTGVQTPAADMLSDEQRKALRQELEQTVARSGWESLIENIKARAEITVNRQNLDI